MSQKPERLICEVVFGSHLYGTATLASDFDYKGIFIPSLSEILLGRIPKTANSMRGDDSRKNEAGELDIEFFSIHHFLRLATQGQTVAIDMLYAPDHMVYKSDTYGWVWDEIQAHKHAFLSKQMNAFIGYARAQAAKYSLKGDRLNKLRAFKSVLDSAITVYGRDPSTPISEAWHSLPRDDERQNPQGIRELQIAGKWYGESTSISNVLLSVEKSLARYGKRAKGAADAEGVDWKALSHAVRVSKELLEILRTGNLRFPLRDAKLLLAIKAGDVSIEEVQDIIDQDLAAVEAATVASNLPDKVDTKFWDDFLINILVKVN